MSLNFKAPENIVIKPIITVFGIGGAGGNAVNNMIATNLQGANFVVANTDAQSLEHSLCDNKIQLGATLTRGLGAGASPEIGAAAAEESEAEIREFLEGSNMVFITAGMGGGTGTGSSPIIAKIAKELGILTIGVVTKPFHFEGGHRMKAADKGLIDLQQHVDTLVVIPNQNLFRIANENTTFQDAFKIADDVLHAAVKSVIDLMIMPGLINLDFNDISTIMKKMGKAMMGTGEASGEDRAVKAAEAAISNPLLDHNSMRGARGVLINITGGQDMKLFEVDNAANRIRKEVGDSDANIIFGSTFNPELNGVMRVSVFATGIDADQLYTQPQQSAEANMENIEELNDDIEISELTLLDDMVPSHEQDEELKEQLVSSKAQILSPAFALAEELVGQQSSSPANNSKGSLFSKMWNSLKGNDSPGTLVQNNIIEPKLNDPEPDIQEVPAFFRKQK